MLLQTAAHLHALHTNGQAIGCSSTPSPTLRAHPCHTNPSQAYLHARPILYIAQAQPPATPTYSPTSLHLRPAARPCCLYQLPTPSVARRKKRKGLAFLMRKKGRRSCIRLRRKKEIAKSEKKEKREENKGKIGKTCVYFSFSFWSF